ncbi:MAG: hypothetical protein FWC36_04555 [Spirochaetes bacterium]|nr:hypothetical protein [Spirochaetota bacterium]
MYKKIILLTVIFKIVFSVSAQETENVSERKLRQQSFLRAPRVQQQVPESSETNIIRNYLIKFYLRIFDHENNYLVNSSWNRVTRSGQPVTVNLRANNLNIMVLFIPYFVDEDSIMLLSQSKVFVKHANYSGGKYYSAVSTIPLRMGEKALFFPLGILHDRVENIPNCILEIKVLPHNESR